jgi:hypothetical protein
MLAILCALNDLLAKRDRGHRCLSSQSRTWLDGGISLAFVRFSWIVSDQSHRVIKGCYSRSVSLREPWIDLALLRARIADTALR